ncbi:fibronectin type III domain-containing protein [Flavobacterium sp.]|uniref:DUF7619 domain-containing protein n=1 Tax=Flavobacterium sp. TaxID=239 RepID=UPI0022C57EEC|nr:fibronectin type III domain-containing protein [Flavobacterium sp.]MCZ8169177.1 fibronectin type III domain-containing protein [Flavobacterium sp.]
MKKQLLWAFFALLVAPIALIAQNTYTCGETFYDSGGPNGDYGSNENNITIIAPTSLGQTVILSLSSITIAPGDVLTVYDGPSPNYPILGEISDVTNEQFTFIASDPSGTLSMQLVSDATGTASGWVGLVECMQPNCLPPTQISPNTSVAGQVTLSWTDPNNNAGPWEVLILPAGSVPNPSSQGVLVTSPTYMTTLQPGTYNAFIRTICLGAMSDWSIPMTLVINATQPCALPTNFSVSTITSTGAAFAWTAQGSASQWEVVVLPQTAGLPTANTTGTVISLSPFLASGLTPNTQYNFFIRSLCSNSNSAWSAGTYFQTSQSPVVSPNCGELFVDNGGANANYANNSNNTYVICPTTPGQVVTVAFTSFSIETGWDGLYVFNGNSTSAPQISSGNNGNSIPGGLPGAFWGTTIPGPFTSSASDGCLTFRFVSDNVVNQAGWVANVTCAAPSSCSAPTAVVGSNVTTTSVVVNWANTAQNATQWEVVAVPCGITAPTPNFPATLVTSNPFTLTGLTPSTCYNLFVRAVCSPSDSSAWTVSTASITTLQAPASCGGVFTDAGGPNANYANSTNTTTTICPTNPGEIVTVTFTTFALEATYDAMYVYNGSSVNAPQIPSTNGAGNVPGGLAGGYWGTLTGTGLPSFTSSSPDGCLTFRFVSDASVTAPGWVANVTCGPAPTCLKPTNTVVSNVTQTSMIVSWTPALASDTQWEVFVLPCTAPAPTTSTTGGILVSSPIFVATGLSPNTCYRIYVRTVCSANDVSICDFTPNSTTLIAPPACGGSFTDNGGANGNYPNNSNETYTICPTNAGDLVTVTFTAFNTEANWDALYVFNGNSTAAPMIPSTNGAANVPGGVAGGYWGTAIPGPFTSSSPDGCLTFRFVSDASVNAAGWVANVSCAPDLPKIVVVAFVDTNSNGVQDQGEPNFPSGNFVVQQNNSGTDMLVYAPTGMYSIYDANPTNTYDVSYQILPEALPYFSGNGFTVNDVNIPANGGTQVFYFPITNTQPFSDVEVSISPVGAPPRPGLSYMQRVIIKNLGIAPASGTLTYNKPSAVTVTNVSPAGTTANANGFTYAYTNLAPNQTLAFMVTLSVPTTPTVNMNDILTATATVVSGNDINAANNTASLSQIVVNSWDPNDKMESHGDKIPFSAFTADDYLFYTIRFQNMGTANAIDVRIEDDLDALLDAESIRMVSSSHNYVMTREGTHVEWLFTNIQLVPEIVSPQQSQGYVTFRIKLNPGFQVGTIVPNTASIYFDSNPAIVTNTWTTKFTAPLGVNEQEWVAFVMYPNPASNTLTFEANTNGSALEAIRIYDVLGKTMLSSQHINAVQHSMDIDTLPQGVYFVEIESVTGQHFTQKLIKK